MIRVFSPDYQGDQFYAMMGRFFASLNIKRELEAQVYNKPNTTWYIMTDRKIVVGFASVYDNGQYYFIDNFYVIPERRGNGIGKEIIEHIVEAYTDKPIKCIACNPVALKIFDYFGFIEVGKNGKYKKLTKY